MIERRVISDPVFTPYSYEGVPDIRIIVFKGFPVMAMLRLATHTSDGKANLHQGAIGVGIDLASGKALKAVQFDQPITIHPDTHQRFEHLEVPHWDSILEQAAACYEMTKLGYLGVDIVLDKQVGPQILELNARPGLAIQLANGAGLTPRLTTIDTLTLQHRYIKERVAYTKQHLAAKS